MSTTVRTSTKLTFFQRNILPLSILLWVSLFLISCETTSSNDFEPIIIEGIVVDSGDNPINDAVVRIVDPRPERFTVTNSNGEYSFEIDVDSTLTVTVVASKEGFETKSQNFVAIPERNVTLPSFQLRSLTESPPNDDPSDPTDPTDPVDPDAPLAEAASIYLEEMSANEIGVRGTGQREDTKLTFQIVDLNGNPLREGNKVDVNFRFGNRPDGGEILTTETITSNNSGQVTATLLSGTVSGTVQVVAKFTRENGTVVQSQPVSVVIHAGLPSQDHFSLLTETRNAAFGTGQTVVMTALVGDKYGNVVPDGTAIYFTTNGGFIQGSSYTEAGRASATLTVANPFPSAANGLATITASTTNDNQQSISTSGQIIFSLSPIITVSPGTFNIPNEEDQQFFYSVKDVNGKPMVAGTSITVTVEGDAVNVLGDVSVTLREPGSFASFAVLTDYSFTVEDSNEEVNDAPVQITIESEGPNGYTKLTITGRKSKEIASHEN